MASFIPSPGAPAPVNTCTLAAMPHCVRNVAAAAAVKITDSPAAIVAPAGIAIATAAERALSVHLNPPIGIGAVPTLVSSQKSDKPSD